MSARDKKHAALVIISVGSVIWAWVWGIRWMMDGGNIFNFYSFFADAYEFGGTAAFLTVDIVAAWATYLIWVYFDAQRIGMGRNKGIMWMLLSLPGTCFAFPLYIVARERFLDARNDSGEQAASVA